MAEQCVRNYHQAMAWALAKSDHVMLSRSDRDWERSCGSRRKASAQAIIGPITLLSAVSAGGSLALARRADKLNFLDARADVAKVGVTGG